MRLYAYWRSSASWRVRIGLHLKGLQAEIVPVHLVRDGGEQRGPMHTARNPMQQVPVLEIDHEGQSVQLAQSLAILAYLEQRWPEPALWPSDPVGRAHATWHAQIVNAGIQPLQNLEVLQRVEGLGGDKVAWARHYIGKGLAAMEALARRTSGDFLVGDQVTVADLCLVPQLYNARRFSLDLSELPTLCAIDARCAQLDPFRAAHPDRQPDAQPT